MGSLKNSYWSNCACYEFTFRADFGFLQDTIFLILIYSTFLSVNDSLERVAVFFQIILALHIWTVCLIYNTSIFILFSWWLACSSCYSSLSLYMWFFLFVNLLLFWLWNYIFGTVFHFWCQEFLYFSSNVAHE